MGDRHDYVALEWVKGEIAETLKQARQALEAFVENPQDATRMRFCQTYVHQVHGTLQMVEFYGAALLAEEMEQLTQALLDGRVGNQPEALEVLMQAILQLPAYLDRIQSARRDLPMVVLPLLNDLRAARGENLLSETSLFSPDLSGRLPALPLDSLEKLRTAELPVLLRKLRQMLQMALVGVIRNQDLATNLGYMARVFARLETLCKDAPLGPLWQIASGMVEGLANGSVVNSTSVRTLLRQVDKELKRLVDQGADGINQAAPDELTKNLLFYVAKAPSQSPRIRSLKDQYRLDDALPDSGVVDEERARLAGPDRDAMRSVVGALCEELVRVKDSLDLFVRSDRQQVAELDALLAPLKQIADTLAVLGFGQPRKVILDQIDVVHALSLGQREPNDAVLMDVAGALLYVEATLAGMVGPGDDAQSEQSHLPTTDVAQIHQLVIKEARTGLEQAKDAIIEFIASQWNHEHLARVPELLTQVRGGLGMIPLQRAAELLEACNRYICERLLEPRAVPDWQHLDTLADAITGVEYYLERLSEDHASQGELILDVAEESLGSLGYAPRKAATAEPAQTEARSLDWLADDMREPAQAEPPADVPAPETLESFVDDLFAPAAEPSLFEMLERDVEGDDAPAAVEPPPMTVADVLAAPEPGINPPAQAAPPSIQPPPADEEPVDEELLDVFIEEAGEVLETIQQYLPQWCADGDNHEALTEVRRAFHTLKGSGRMVRALVIGELAWAVENLFNRLLDRSIDTSPAVHELVDAVVALLPELIDEFAAKAQRQRDDVDRLAAIAHALARGQQPEAPTPQAPSAVAENVDGGLDPQLLDIFRNEAESHLETLDQFLAECAQALPQPINDRLQRALHTLKGSAHMAGILPMAEVVKPLERLVKEFHNHQIPVDRELAELLARTRELLHQGLAQLDSSPHAGLPGSEALQAEVLALQQDRLSQAEARRASSEPHASELLGRHLGDHIDTLLDSEELLARWRADGDSTLESLWAAVEALRQGARQAKLAALADLCEALVGVYAAVGEGTLLSDARFFDEALAAHEALVGMLDQVAAALQVTPRPDRIEALVALLAEPAALPEADFDFDALPEELLELDPLELAFEPLESAPADLPPLVAADPDPAPIPAAADPGEPLDEEMVEIFLEEAVDILDSAAQSLEDWLADSEDHNALGALQRDLHTLKGGARMAGIAAIGDLAHELEFLYEGLMERRFSAEPTLAWLLHKCHDRLVRQIEQLQAREPVTAADSLIRAITDFRATGAVSLEAQEEEAVNTPEGDLWAALEAAEHLELEGFGDFEELEAPAPAASAGGGEIDVLDVHADPELMALFLEESFGLIEDAKGALERWRVDPRNSLEIETLQRDLHTIKGCARMADVQPIGDLGYELETLYRQMSDGRLRTGEHLFELLERSHAHVYRQLEAVRDGREVPDGGELIEALQRFMAAPEEQLSEPASVTLQPVVEPEPPAPIPAQPAAGGAEVDEEILEIFREEADELIEALQACLQGWDAMREAVPFDDLLRILHTLKGGARLAGQTHLGTLSHELEQYLIEARQKGEPQSDALFEEVGRQFEALQTAVDGLRGLLDEADLVAEPVVEPPAPEPVRETALVDTAAPAAAPLPFVLQAEKAREAAAARRAPQELVKVPAELLDDLVNLAGETSIFRGRVEQQVSDVGYTLTEMEATIERVRDQLRRLDTETQAQILSRYQAEAERAGYEDFDPLEMDRHSQLQQLSRALFESASDLLELKETLAAKNRDAETLLLQQSRVNTELQEGLMRTRMVPFDRLVPRLRRIVRQVSVELGKQVDMVVGNAEGEMDRSVLERIIAPLEHMLRNAVDHGIEPLEVRRAAGKPDQGTISLNLAREGGEMVLTLADDGGGIRLDAVRRKAIDRGLMAADSDITDHEILQFILAAGFSTAEKITQISGRGVGLDVVTSEIKQLGGSVSIESAEGQGTRFVIRLPFTVSVNRALMVHSGEDLYAVPLSNIEGIVRVSPHDLETYYGPDAPRFEYGGQRYELRYLGELLNNGQQPKLVGQVLPLPVILVRSADHSVAVQVDSLAGSREIVVKSLGPQFARVAGISGATILGDGRVVVILDFMTLLRKRQLLALPGRGAQPRLALEAQGDGEAGSGALTVMVVDDSVTVRKVTTRLLERQGMNVVTAKDGVDAITQLQELKPDIMLLDIEMPRMDGFEVATLVRHEPRLADMPIIMITSRTGDKHRERALAIGVNDYLGKPYQEAQLLERIHALVERS
ncbi:MAG TPA: Hpt domain-containing protein [Pseudomonas sp.]|nr:Hpt domain-containing protein [Pseudomonas sp.]